jgi:hypothetical protein
MSGSLFQIIIYIGLISSQNEKAELLFLLGEAFPITIQTSPLVSEETVRECLPIDNSEGLFAAVCKSANQHPK